MGLFDEQISRKPDHYPWTEKFIDSMHAGFWTEKEFNFQSVKKYWAKLGDNLPQPSVIDLGYVMAGVEVIHNKAYEKLLVVLGLTDIFEENLKLDIIKNRVNYLHKHTHKFHKDNKQQFIYSLILFTLFVENVSLFSQFYIINWFGRFKNVLKDTNQQTQYTRNEETIHALVGIKLVNVLSEEYPELFDKALEEKIAYEAVQAFKYESEIVDWMLGSFEYPGLNTEIVKEFIKNRINESLNQIGFNSIFEINQELLKATEWFNEEVLGNNMSDFFHTRPVEYSKKNQSFSEEDLF
jgi:ribonucleoside-diphosphate reductase beta chain